YSVSHRARLASAGRIATVIWEPSREFVESTNMWRFMRRLGFMNREEFLRFSREDIARFWDETVREIGIEWFEPYTRTFDDSHGPEWTEWFLCGKLNIAHNCLDRWASTDRVACIWEAENGASSSLTFGELQRAANGVSNGLRALGLQPGDRVAICM